ncbi:MAG: DUF4105 domain-containing protein [Rhodospirillales bacterium]|nr:DUF4105 domain-containing protein [Rhodospirillales bacterium]
MLRLRPSSAFAAILFALAVVGPWRMTASAREDGSAGAIHDAYLDELIARARDANLADRREWRALLHYEPRLAGGVSSVIDSRSFFASPDGKTDPQAELEATLTSFFEPMPAGGPDDSAQCLRIARYHWLRDELQFDSARLPERPCPAFEAWYRTLDPAQITLAYPSAYLNNPSSMFGHTLLRIDPPGQSDQTRLLSFAINFAADTGPDGGALFAVKGLAGGYRGYFSVMPYYEKVSQYSDIENRDIWEYQLNLTPDQIRRMLQSLWELRDQYVDYYFLSTNCSYLLLSLINTARPDLDLKRGLWLYAIPVDTVRSILRDQGLLKRVVYRPSGMTQIKNLRDHMSASDRQLALALADGRLEPQSPAMADLRPEDQARILELAQSLLQYRLNTGEEGRDVVAPRSLRLLQARAALSDLSGPDPRRVEPPAVRPDEGHESVRLNLSVGMTGSNPFVELGLRPAYHDLVDPPAGYPPGAEIEILGVRARSYFDDPLPRLEDFTAAGIKSMAVRDDFFQPISWRAKVGVERFREEASDAGWLVGVVEGGVGGTWSLGDGAIVSALLGGSLFADRDWPEDRIAGLGPELGLSWPITPWWTTRLEGRWQAVAGSDRIGDRYGVQLSQGFRLGRNLSLRLDGGLRNDGGDAFAEWMSSLQWYF